MCLSSSRAAPFDQHAISMSEDVKDIPAAIFFKKAKRKTLFIPSKPPFRLINLGPQESNQERGPGLLIAVALVRGIH